MQRVVRALLLAFGLFACAPMLAPHAARAQAGDERAEMFNKEGRQLFEMGQYEEAVNRFEQAFAAAAKSKYLYNLAYAYDLSGKPAKSKEAFTKYLEICRNETGNQCPDEARVQTEIERLDDILFKSLPKVFVDSSPTGANVFFTDPKTNEERLLGQTPLTLRLAEGAYQVRLEMEGHETLRHTFEVQRIGDLRLSFPLSRLTNLGRLEVNVNVRGARIYVDGTIYGLSPREKPLEIQAGPRQVVVEKDGYGRASKEVVVVSGQATAVDFELGLADSPATWRSYVGWPLFSVGLLGIGAGITFWQLADEEFQGTPKFEDYELYQNLGYGIGGGLLGVGMGLLIWEWVDPVTTAAGDDVGFRPVPLIAPTADGAAFGLMGRF